MSSRIYSRLALGNIKNNRKTYVPFILTSILTVMMFYIISALAGNESIENFDVITVLRMAAGIMMIFSVIFLFYTNSFLIKRRKKEIAVYNILGMGKGHIGKMLTVETLLTGGISIAGGIAGGVIFGKLMHLILMRVIHFDLGVSFAVSGSSVGRTIFLFMCIFFLTWFYNLMQIRISNPIELLRGGSQGEKEPKTKLVMTVVGVIAMAAGYYLALSTERPIEAIGRFFMAVVLVIIGTYTLFIAGSIALLKVLRKRKKFYYKPNHFVAVSGMIYRMKQNAVGLANICILSTVVLVMISSTVSLYMGMDEVLANRFHHDYQMTLYDAGDENVARADRIIDDGLALKGLERKDEIRYRYGASVLVKEGEDSFTSENTYDYSADNILEVFLIPLEEYEKLENTSASLDDDEVMVYVTDQEGYGQAGISIDGRKYKVAKELDDLVLEHKNSSRAVSAMYLITASKEQTEEIGKLDGWSYDIDFNMTGSDEDKAIVEQKINEDIRAQIPNTHFQSRQEGEKNIFGSYGCLFFIGLYLGSMFLMATVLIIYYKQISEGMDDRQRYVIMQKVGMEKREIRRAIRSQILTVFFLPLIVSILHIVVAFKVVTKLLALLGLVNTGLFIACTAGTVLIFALFYVIVFAITAREYYKIVN